MKKDVLKQIFDYVMLVLGAVIAAFAIEEFLVPCTILDGGVVGIGIIVNHLTGIKLGILTLVINFPFLIVGTKKTGAYIYHPLLLRNGRFCHCA